MRKCLTYLALISIVLIGGSCERRPLYDEDANVHISFVFDDEMPNVDVLPIPELMKVNLYQAASSASLKHSCYIKPEGGNAKVDFNTYNISAYNFDTDFVQVRGENDINQTEAYTSYVQADPMADYNKLFRLTQEHRAALNAASRIVEDYSNQELINQPDYFFVGKLTDQTIISRDVDDVCNIVIPVSSIVKTYLLDIRSIVGAEYISSADAYITGQAMSKYIHSQEVTGDPCSIHVELMAQDGSEELTALFTTFDHHPLARSYVVLQLVDYRGNMQVYEWDVTDQFNDETNKERIIHINTLITIDPPAANENETMLPVVKLWDENNYVINL